jgi:RNA polymerase sigma factor (sigma-70 family)
LFESILSIKASQSQHLSIADQRELVRKYQEKGCRRSLDALVESNLKLVCKVASKYNHHSTSSEDFLAEGVRGIMKAADKYDLNSDASFATYAYQWIRHYCGRHLENFTKQPWHQRLDKPINQNGGTVATLIADDSLGQEELYEQFELIERVQQAISIFCEDLKEREEIIFQKRTVADEPLTLQDLGDSLGITKERVRQIESLLLSKFKAYLVKVM